MFFILVQQPLKTCDKLSDLTLVYPDDIGVCCGEEILMYLLHLCLTSTWISKFWGFFIIGSDIVHWFFIWPLLDMLVLSSHAEMCFIDIKNS